MSSLETLLLFKFQSNKFSMFYNPYVNNLLVCGLNFYVIFICLKESKRYFEKYKKRTMSVLIFEFGMGSVLLLWKMYYFIGHANYIAVLPHVLLGLYLLIILFKKEYDIYLIRNFKSYAYFGERVNYAYEILFFVFIYFFLTIFHLFKLKSILIIIFTTFATSIANWKNETLESRKFKFQKEKTVQGAIAYNISGILISFFFTFLLLKKVYLKEIIAIAFFTTFIYILSPKFVEKIIIFLSILFLFQLL